MTPGSEESMKSSLKLITGVILLMILLASCTTEEFGVAIGDKVLVNYIGSFENGTVFDTNVAHVAEANSLERNSFMPLEVTLGHGKVIQGFEQALIGMKKGEKKKITIIPEKGYGLVSKGKIISLDTQVSVDRVIELDRNRNVDIGLVGDVKAGDIVELGDISYEIVSIKDGKADIFVNVEEGDKMQLPNTFWNSTVSEVTKNKYYVRQDPEEGMVLNTPFGPAEIQVTKDKLIRKMQIQQGGYLKTEQGTGRVVLVNETKAVIDFNHPLAGQTLIFEIELVEQ